LHATCPVHLILWECNYCKIYCKQRIC
jgi:hypothetical protein